MMIDKNSRNIGNQNMKIDIRVHNDNIFKYINDNIF